METRGLRIDTGAGVLFPGSRWVSQIQRVLSKLGELPWNLSSRELNQHNPGELEFLKGEVSLNKERFYLKIKLTVACVTRIYPHCWCLGSKESVGKAGAHHISHTFLSHTGPGCHQGLPGGQNWHCIAIHIRGQCWLSINGLFVFCSVILAHIGALLLPHPLVCQSCAAQRESKSCSVTAGTGAHVEKKTREI